MDLMELLRQLFGGQRDPQAGDPARQPHDPQDYLDMNPMAMAPEIEAMRSEGSRLRDSFGGSLLQLLEAPPLAGPSRGFSAMLRGEDPIAAFAAGDSSRNPEMYETLVERGWHPAAAFGVEAAIPDLFSGPGDVLGTALGLAAIVPRIGRGSLADMAEAASRIARGVDAEDLTARVRAGEGFTIDPATGKPAREGFAVGGLGTEMRVPASEATPDTLTTFVSENVEALARPDTRLGAWIDDETGEVVYDVSNLVGASKRHNAFTQAIARGEDAIYNLGEGVSHRIQTVLGDPALRADSTIIRPGDADWISVDELPFVRGIREDVDARIAAGMDVTDWREGANADTFLNRTVSANREAGVVRPLTDARAAALDSNSFYDNMMQTPHAKSFEASVRTVEEALPNAEILARQGIEVGGHLWYPNQEVLDVFVRAFPDDPAAARSNYEWHMAINALSSNNSDPYKQVLRTFLIDTLLHTEAGQELFFRAGRETPYAVQDLVLKPYGAGNNSWAQIHSYISELASGGTPMFNVNKAHKMQTFYPHLIGSPVNSTGDRWHARSMGLPEGLMNAPHHYAASEWGTMRLTELLNSAQAAPGGRVLTHPDVQAAVWVGKQISEGVDPSTVTARFSDIWMGGVRELAERTGIPFEEAQLRAARGEIPLPEILGAAGTAAFVGLVVGETDFVDWSMSMLREDEQDTLGLANMETF